MKVDTYPVGSGNSADAQHAEGHLRRAVDEYLAHYHCERNHQGIGNELIEAKPSMGTAVGGSTERLGGMLRYYHRAA